MSDEIFAAVIKRTRQYCALSGQKEIRLGFHGGEPCLLPVQQFREWCDFARAELNGIKLHLSVQTNGTLIDERWIDAFREHAVDVGISMDGPKAVHDIFREDHAGRGSYDKVARGLSRLKEANIRYGILCVITLGADPLAIQRHFVELGCPRVTYILPDFTHDSIGEVRGRYGETPCADFLIQIFDEWWFNGSLEIRIADLWNIARVVLGGDSEIETIGNSAPAYIFVETDGSMEGLDSLRVCKEGASRIGFNVLNEGFEAIAAAGGIHATAIFKGLPLPAGCKGCPEEFTCAGGYLPHRYSAERGFDNPSVWCADLLKLFKHVRLRLGVTVKQTRAYQEELRETKLKLLQAQAGGGSDRSTSPRVMKEISQ
jgi:uncharacterized protein